MKYIKKLSDKQKRRIHMVKVWSKNIKMVIDNMMFNLDDMKEKLKYGGCPFSCECAHEIECLADVESELHDEVEEEVIEDYDFRYAILDEGLSRDEILDEIHDLTMQSIDEGIDLCGKEMQEIVDCPFYENKEEYRQGEIYFINGGNTNLYLAFFDLVYAVNQKLKIKEGLGLE